MNLSRYQINDRLTALAQECGVDTADEEFDDTLNDLTHTVADAFAATVARQRGLPTAEEAE